MKEREGEGEGYRERIGGVKNIGEIERKDNEEARCEWENEEMIAERGAS